MHPTQQETDTILLQTATAKLRKALHLASTNPAVAHWLFSNKSYPFHTDTPLLPPEAFQSGLALQISDLFTHFVPTTNPFDSPFPQHAFLGSGTGRLPPPEQTSSSKIQLLFVPASVVNGIVYGYSFSVVASFEEHFVPFEFMTPGDFQMKGRFVFDMKARSMLCMLNNLTPSVAGVISLSSLENNRRSKDFFTVPNIQYSFQRLPDRVLAIVTNIEYKIESAALSQFPKKDSDVVDLTGPDLSPADHFAAAFQNGANTKRKQGGLAGEQLSDWAAEFMNTLNGDAADKTGENYEGRANGRACDDIVALDKAMGGDTAGSTWNMDAISQSLAEIEDVMGGKYFAPRLSRDVMHPVTGEVTMRVCGEMRTSLEPAAPSDRKMIREIAAQVYYANAMSVTADRALVNGGYDANPRLSQNGCVVHNGVTMKRKRTEGEMMLMPKPLAPVCTSCQCNVVAYPAPVQMDEESIKEMKKEAKRRKNRLSAAKSNQKRKERVIAQQKELEELKEKAQTLKGLEERLKVENRELKGRVGQ